MTNENFDINSSIDNVDNKLLANLVDTLKIKNKELFSLIQNSEKITLFLNKLNYSVLTIVKDLEKIEILSQTKLGLYNHDDYLEIIDSNKITNKFANEYLIKNLFNLDVNYYFKDYLIQNISNEILNLCELDKEDNIDDNVQNLKENKHKDKSEIEVIQNILDVYFDQIKNLFNTETSIDILSNYNNMIRLQLKGYLTSYDLNKNNSNNNAEFNFESLSDSFYIDNQKNSQNLNVKNCVLLKKNGDRKENCMLTINKFEECDKNTKKLINSSVDIGNNEEENVIRMLMSL